MNIYYFDYKHIRLAAKQVAEGWVAVVYDISKEKILHEDGVIHQISEDAKQDAQIYGEQILRETLGPINWKG